MQIELLSHFGDDTMVANVARVSYAKEASNYTEEQNAKLINYLYKHGHTSCFRHPQLQFRIKCPIYVERQLFKHQTGISVNSISGRYVDFSDSYYTIDHWRRQSKSSKQGSDGLLSPDQQLTAKTVEEKVLTICKQAYQDLLAMGVAKEQARSVLPLSLETEFIWTGSLLAFFHMCDLRLKSDAQAETRWIVEQMLLQIVELKDFTHSLQAWFGN